MFKRPFFAPEVVQTSAMDCGPATLKCLLAGYGLYVSYGRLREACQTDVDGTSIDTLEEIANQLGIAAEQQVLPADFLLDTKASSLPAIAVTTQPNGFLHFVVLWSLHGDYVQLVNPLEGRQWMHKRELQKELYRHAMPVGVEDWWEWAQEDDFQGIMVRRMLALGFSEGQAAEHLASAMAHGSHQSMAALDAALRLGATMVASQSIRVGQESQKLIEGAWQRALEGGVEAIPKHFWSVLPHPQAPDEVILRGAVILSGQGGLIPEAQRPQNLPPELQAALDEKPPNPLVDLWKIVGDGGWKVPGYLVSLLALSALGLLIEALIFRGLFEIWADLALLPQRAGALLMVGLFLTLMLAFEILGQGGLWRLGRRIEVGVRTAFLHKLSHLSDRYFHSRPISEVSGRSHSIHTIRELPHLLGGIFRVAFELILTAGALIWLYPGGGGWVFLALLLSLSLPFALQPIMVERELRARSHGEALSRYYLDGLLGLVAARSHSAEGVLRSEHEGILSAWMHSAYRLHRVVVGSEALHLCVSLLVSAGLFLNYIAAHDQGGSLLLYLYWALNLPFLGQELGRQARLYPSRRNITERMMELLLAKGERDMAAAEVPEAGLSTETEAADKRESDGDGNARHPSENPVPRPEKSTGVRLDFEGVDILVAGHRVLHQLSTQIQAGEHVAVVGPSGAGKSTLVGLLLGWHRAHQGRVRVDGAPLKGQSLQKLRQSTVWIDPAVQIWNKPLINNLFYANAAGASTSLGETLELGQLTGVVERLPQGLQSPLGEGGGLLSGGEGQRVRFSRGLLQETPRLVILDEPFRGLDRVQRGQLLRAARAKWADTTLICVTHDVGETQHFPRVMVMEGGQCIEDGVPADLLKKEASRYRDLMEAEQRLRSDLWAGDHWRRLHLEGGHLREEGGQ